MNPLRYFSILMTSALLLGFAAPSHSGEVWLLDLKGPIGPASADYLTRNMSAAESAGAEAVILQMDTPGGLDSAMRDIIHRILALNIPVITYVAPQGSRAASAGTYILYASHVAAMAPATNLGAATPVQLGGSSPLSGRDKTDPQSGQSDDNTNDENNPKISGGDALTHKVVNDAKAYIRGLAQLRGRNAEWAEEAVTSAASLAAEQALEQNVIDLIAEDLDDLLRQLDGVPIVMGKGSVTLTADTISVKAISPDWRTRFLQVVTNPSVAYILLLVGIYGLIFELSNPGIGAGGIIGGICLFIALYALQLLPVSYSAMGLLLFGMGLMIAEALSPSFGLLGLGGIIAFVVGSIMLMDTDIPAFQVALPLILSFAAVSAGLLIMTFGMLLKTRRLQTITGTQTLINQEAEVTSLHQNHAMVRLQGELWRVDCDQPLAVGDRVRVTGIQGLTLQVTKEIAP